MTTQAYTPAPPALHATAEAPQPPAPRRPNGLLIGGIFLLVLVAALLGWKWLDGAETEPVPDAAPTAAQGAAGGLAAADFNGDGIVYQSGMHPWIVEDAPGKCPICGMDLQPVSVTGAVEGVVSIDPVTMQNIGVRTAPVALRALERELRATGTFEVNERGRTAVSLKIGGWVEDLYVNAEGDRVRAGQPLLALYSPQLVSTQEEYQLALRNRSLLGGENGDRLVEAARRRLLLFDISPEQIARLESTGEVQRTLTIYAPASGTVVEKNVVEGQQVMAGATLMQIADLSRLWLQVAVPEQDLGWVAVGTRAVVRLESMPGQELTGQVEYVYDTLDPSTRTGTARVSVPNPGRQIKPGMYAVATLYGTPSEALPSVPSEAVIRTGDDAVVILALGEGRFRPQPVVLGAEAGGFVQVLEGLTGDEVVVTSAQFLIDSEARLAAAVGAMTGTPGTAETAPLEVDHSQMNH